MPDAVYRIGIVRRARYVGIAVLRGTTLVWLATRRQTGRCHVQDLIARLCRDYAVEEGIIEPDARCPVAVPVATVSLGTATAALIPTHPRPTRRALTQELLQRFPTLRRGVGLSRDRTVALYALALVLTRATPTH